jgi:hypothetical protein
VLTLLQARIVRTTCRATGSHAHSVSVKVIETVYYIVYRKVCTQLCSTVATVALQVLPVYSAAFKFLKYYLSHVQSLVVIDVTCVRCSNTILLQQRICSTTGLWQYFHNEGAP